MTARGIIVLMTAELAFLPVVVYIAPPLLKVCVWNIAADNILSIVLLIGNDGVSLCDFHSKCAVCPALAAFAAFPILDIALMLVFAVGAGRFGAGMVYNYAAVGVGVLAQLVCLVADLKQNTAVCTVDIAAVTGCADGGFNCIARLTICMVVGIYIAIGKAAGGADRRRLAVCRAAGVCADIGAFFTSRTLLSMIDSVTFGEFYPCIVVFERSNGNIAFLAVLARAVGISVVLAAGGALVVRQVAFFVTGRGGICMLYKLRMLAFVLCDLGVAGLCILGFEVCILKICIAFIAIPIRVIALRGAGRLGVFLVSHLVGRVIVGIFFARKLESGQSGCLSACLILEKLAAFLA